MKQEPKKEKEYTIGFLIFLIISATVIGVLFINFLNCCIPEKYKFDKEIWGSVSDWFTYLVALIGGVFIYKTLNSQMKVQIDQNRIFKIEENKYLREIRPYIKISFMNRKDWHEGKLKCIYQTLTFIGKPKGKFSFKVYDDKNVYVEEKRKIPFTEQSLGIIKKFTILPIHDNIFNNLKIEVLYWDMDNNQYKMYNEYSIKNSGIELDYTLLSEISYDELDTKTY